MRLLVFEPYEGGHQAVYARHLLAGWSRCGAPGTLVLAARASVLDALEASGATTGVTTSLLRPDEVVPPGHGVSTVAGPGWMAPIRRLAAEHRPDRVLAMNFECLVGPLARRVRIPHVPTLSALAFHTGADRLRTPRTVLRNLVVRRALRHPNLQTLYTVDPSAPPRIRAMGTHAEVVAVPDPVPDALPVPPTAETRAAWGIDPERRLAVLTGTLDGRKGATVLLDALARLEDGTAGRLAVVIAGRVAEPMRSDVTHGVAHVQDETTVQLVHRPGFVSDADLAALTSAADVVLLPYSGQIGSSGFLMSAAAAGTPVLTQDTGLMAWLTRTHGLGQTVDTRSPDAVADGLARAVADPSVGFRPEGAAALAAAHSPDAFADALLGPILRPTR